MTDRKLICEVAFEVAKVAVNDSGVSDDKPPTDKQTGKLKRDYSLGTGLFALKKRLTQAERIAINQGGLNAIDNFFEEHAQALPVGRPSFRLLPIKVEVRVWRELRELSP